MFLSWRVVRRAGVLPSMMKIKTFIMSAIFMAFSVAPVLAAGPGYTNVCGSGTAANNYDNSRCPANCDMGSGNCTAGATQYIFRFQCQGNQTVCTAINEEKGGPGTTKNVKNVPCGQTAQVDVFNHDCRNNGWSCSDSDVLGYLVYYGGDCGGTTTTTSNNAPGCDSGQVNMNVNPNPARVGENMSFVVGGSQGSTWVEDYWSGGVSCSGGFWGNKGCSANNAGSFTWTHVWYNTAQNDFNTKSARCEKSVSYSISGSNPTPTPTPTPTPFPTPTPTPTPTPAPGATPTPTPTPTPVARVTPRTGFDLYSTVSILMTSGWAGYLLLRKRKV